MCVHSIGCSLSHRVRELDEKLVTWMFTRHLGSHNLANLIQATSNEMTLPEHVSSCTLTWSDMAHLTKWRHKWENGKWVTQMCTRHLGSHKIEKLIWPPLNETTQPKRVSSDVLAWRDMIRLTEQRQKGENGKQAAWMFTRHSGSHNLENSIQSHSNEMTWPKHDSSGTLKQNNPTRTCFITRPHTARHCVPDQMNSDGEKQQTGCTKLRKAP